MKILLYGVGAIGSLVTHYLIKAGNDVTVVARSTAEVLKKDGLVIEHYLQGHKVTVDHPNVVSKASYDEKYDIVFSVMQGQQQFTVLDELAKVNTKLIVMVGNNLESDKCEEYIKEHSVSERTILYGFQNSAGHREGGKAVVRRLPVIELFLGGLHEPVDTAAIKKVKEAFAVKGYKITEVADMRAYYFYHIAEIMPYILMCYKVDCDINTNF